MKYAAKKIVWMLLTMVIVSFLAFLAFRIIPGDPTAKLLGEQATPERVEALRQELGLDRPFLERYVSWLGDFVRGDMGSSYNYSMPVSRCCGENSRDGAFDPAVVSADRGAVHPAGTLHRPPQRRGAG